MFGYVRVCKEEMRIKEYEMYKAVYCSLCDTLGKKYGILSRITLNYDFVFLCILNMSLNDKNCPTSRKLCKCNPFKKCSYLNNQNDIEMPSAAAMIMLYYKVLDNIEDEKGFKKLFYFFLKLLYFSAHKKAARDYPLIEDIFYKYIDSQKKLEKENNQSVDAAADPTANALSEVFKLCSESEIEKRILSRLGYCIGRYIYLLDAACDLEEDIKKNNYNPLKIYIEDKDYLKNSIVPELYICLSEAAKALELLNIKKLKNILDNIIYLGLEDTLKKELKI